MNALGFQADIRISDVINQGDFTLSAEIIPPRNGIEQSLVFEQIEALVQSGAQFLSVTKGAGGSLRGGSLPIAQAIKERFKIPAIAHFTCRDLTPQEVENQLMDHHYFGIRNILALRGDPPQDQPNWEPQGDSHHYAYQLIEQIRNLNKGEYLTRPGGRNPATPEPTEFCIGAAVYPEHPDEAERLEFFKRKIEAGAEYGITQMLFDPEIYARFRELLDKNGVNAPIVPGTRILKSKKQAQRMSERFEVSIGQIFNGIPETASPENLERSVEVFLEYVRKLKSYGAPGIHLFVLSDTKGSSLVLKELSNS